MATLLKKKIEMVKKKSNILKFDDLDYHKIFGSDAVEPNNHMFDDDEGLCGEWYGKVQD
jgi:hypothetical protein